MAHRDRTPRQEAAEARTAKGRAVFLRMVTMGTGALQVGCYCEKRQCELENRVEDQRRGNQHGEVNGGIGEKN